MLAMKAKILGDLIDHLDTADDKDDAGGEGGHHQVVVNVGHAPAQDHMDSVEDMEGLASEGDVSDTDSVIKTYPNSMGDYEKESKPRYITRLVKSLA